MPPIQMTRAEYQAQYGTAPAVAPVSSSAPIKMTRAEYQAQYGAKPSVNASADKASAEKYGATFGASTENPSILGEAAKTLGNMPSSAWNFAKGALDIVNPISTINKLREAGSTFGKLAQEQGGVGNALGLVAKEAPKALYEGLVPEAGRALLAGDTETAQRAITNDPVGQILPFLAAARGGAKMADTAATKTAMADYAKAPYSTRTIPEPITKYGSAFDTGVSKVTEAVTKPISTVAGKVSDYTKGMVQGGVSQTTGLGRETVSRVTAFPEAFTKKAIAETDRASLGKQVQSELAKLSEEKIATGKEYQPIRASTEPVRVDSDFFTNTIKETTGLDIKKGQLTPTGSSKLRDSGDVRAVQKVYDFWKPYFKKGQLTTDEFLNMREDLAKMAKFEKDIGVRKDVQTLSGIMRAKFNEAYRPQIGGLKELDASMHDQLKQFKELTHGLVDKEGNMTDAGMAKIANLSANKPNLALQLEKIVPGITEQIKNLQAITDIERASGIKAFKTGTYVRGALTGGAFLGAGIPAGILTMIMTDPAIAVPILRQYGLLKNARAVNTVIQALKKGASTVNALPAGVPEPLKKDVGQAYTDINKTMAGKGGLSMQDVSKQIPKDNGLATPTVGKTKLSLDNHGTPVSGKGLADPVEGGTYYHGTILENKPTLLKNGFDIAHNKKGFAEQPEAFYFGDYSAASMYGNDMVGVQVRKGETIKTLSSGSQEWADTLGKSTGKETTTAALKELRNKGYDAINYGNEIEVLNPGKFKIIDAQKTKSLYEQVTGKKPEDYKKTNLGKSVSTAQSIPEKTVMYHGTSAPEFQKFKGDVAYLTTERTEANVFAKDPILGGGGQKGPIRTMNVEVPAGKIKNIDDLVMEEIMGDAEINALIARVAKEARTEGYEYLQFEHPGGSGKDFQAYVALYPDKLKITTQKTNLGK